MLQLLLPIVLFLGPQDSQTSHVMDGRFEDWAAPTVAPGTRDGLIKAVRVANDQDFVYIQIDLTKPATLQGLGDREIRIEIDGDNDPKTGVEGLEAVVVFSPRKPGSNAIGIGTAVEVATALGIMAPISPSHLGVVAMPSHASDRFEIRIDRNRKLFEQRNREGTAFRCQVKEVRKTDTGDLADHSLRAFRHAFKPTRRNSERQAVRHMDPAEPASGVRIMSWNGERGALFSEQGNGAFAKTFEAVVPDLVLLQELPDSMQNDKITEWFERLEGDRDWSSVVSEGGLPVAVVSRHPMETVEELAKVEGGAPGGRPRFVRAVGGLTTVEGRRILAVSVHLKCCGSLGSSEDEKRLIEADAIHEAVRRAILRLKPDEVVIGGDLNLVGTPAVLTRLQEGLAPDGGDLVVSEPMRPAGDATTTWERAGQAFVPGQLDFLLVGGTGTITRAMVIDPAQMDERWRRRHGIPAAHPSDHLPILVDVDLTP